MNGKFTVTYADGKTRNYSRKVDVTRAATKSGQEYLITDPKGEVVVQTDGYAAVAEVAAPAADTKAAKPAKKAAAKKADKKPRATVPTFEVKGTEGETHKCIGACGKKLPVAKFPTITGRPGVRTAECRVDRDARTKAEKAARKS